MLARCPTCRATFSTDKTGQQNCPQCGKPLIVPEQPPPVAQLLPEGAPQFAPPAAETPREAPGTPWERRAALGNFEAWKQTILLALFEPGKLFDQARLDQRGEQTWFAVVTCTVFFFLSQIVNKLIGLASGDQEAKIAKLREQLGDKIPVTFWRWLDFNKKHEAAIVIGSVIFMPLVTLIFLWLNALVTHLFALILGQNRKGFAATFTACAYAMAPMALMVIPVCGSLIALVWVVVLIGIGMKRTHDVSPGGATAVALGPYVLFCCALCALSVALGSAAATAINAGGGLPQ